jgi:hypothetical protein
MEPRRIRSRSIGCISGTNCPEIPRNIPKRGRLSLLHFQIPMHFPRIRPIDFSNGDNMLEIAKFTASQMPPVPREQLDKRMKDLEVAIDVARSKLRAREDDFTFRHNVD